MGRSTNIRKGKGEEKGKGKQDQPVEFRFQCCSAKCAAARAARAAAGDPERLDVTVGHAPPKVSDGGDEGSEERK